MADLLPSLSSDDEDDTRRSSSKKRKGDDAGDESDEEAMVMDGSFEYGGILGEDGGLASLVPSNDAVQGWSYQTALRQMQEQQLRQEQANQNSNPHNAATPLPRMDVAALIAAKRQTLQQQQVSNEEEEEDKPRNGEVKKRKKKKEKATEEDVDDAERDDSDKDNDEEESSSTSSSDSESGSDDSDSDDGDDDGVDDTHKHLDGEEDVIKTRSGAGDDEEGKKGNDSEGDEEEEDAEEAAKAAAFFDQESSQPTQQDVQVFAQLSLSRPLLRGIAAMGFVKPTPIQAVAIPVTMQGRDVCASAVTGSGKTAAFLLPLLERLLLWNHGRGRRGGGGSATRAVILTPTRELAAQCLGMFTTFAQFCGSHDGAPPPRAMLLVGGTKNVHAQAAELRRSRPDVIVATPGRLVDHLTNSVGFDLQDVQFLVLDEGDRLLELGFQDEVHEIVKACPLQRQTLLFSATMNTKVDELIKLSLKKPVRIRINRNNAINSGTSGSSKSSKDMEVAPRLDQEFIRIQSGNEGVNREAILLALLTRTFTKQVIVFFETKALAHRMMILCGLCGIKCAELHGNLTQPQRLAALENFSQGKDAEVLLATDLAARGLDIDRVLTVINFEMPNQLETYIHRIGRTARAGRGGRSCTLIGEGRRHLMKQLIKEAEQKQKPQKQQTKSSNQNAALIRSRSIPPAVIAHFAAKIWSLESHIQDVLQAEKVAKMDRLAEMEVIRAQNMLQHSDEIKSRPQREWIKGSGVEQQKKLTNAEWAEKQKAIQEKVGTGIHRMNRKKRRAREAMAEFQAHNDDAENDGDDEDHEAAGVSKKSKKKHHVQEVDARSHKKKMQDDDRATRQQTIQERFDAAENKKAEKQKKKRKVGDHALGDSRLFDEERVAFSSKPRKDQEAKPAVKKSGYDFRGYDPDRKLGKKKGNKSFKSKSKYKRR